MFTTIILAGISLSVLLSYAFMLLGEKWKIPSVVFLLFVGVGLRIISIYTGQEFPVSDEMMSVLGTVGLILIVLEGGLDLELNPKRTAFLKRTFLSALVGLLLCMLVLSIGFKYYFDLRWSHSILVSIPFTVISSAVAIPSASVLKEEFKEFVIYESSWSDILAVMAFNAALIALSSRGWAVGSILIGGLSVAIIGTLLGLAMIWLVSHLEGQVKFIPMIFGLTFVYAIAKGLSLSPLLIVLIIGLMLNNRNLLENREKFNGIYSSHFDTELDKLKNLTTEATFLVRTFFFLLLGYTSPVESFLELQPWLWAIGIVFIIVLLRVPVMILFSNGNVKPLIWMMPRGLITVLLFYSIPKEIIPINFPRATIILVILLTSVIMAAALRLDSKRNNNG